MSILKHRRNWTVENLLVYGLAESILDNICIINAIYRFNIIPIKIIASFFIEMEKAILNIMHKHRRPQIVKTIFSNMGNVGVITSLCYKPTLSTKNITGLSRTGALSQIFSDTLKDVLVHVQQEEVSRTQYPHSQEVGYGRLLVIQWVMNVVITQGNIVYLHKY